MKNAAVLFDTLPPLLNVHLSLISQDPRETLYKSQGERREALESQMDPTKSWTLYHTEEWEWTA